MISDTVRRVSAKQFIHGEGRALLHGFVCRRFLLHARCVILPVCVSVCVCVCVWSAASINRLRPCEPTCGTAVHSVHWTELRVGLFYDVVYAVTMTVGVGLHWTCDKGILIQGGPKK